MNLSQRDQAVIWHPFTPQKNRPLPIAITSGKGSMLYDDAGHAYIDAISSWWVTLHGHAHPYIAQQLYQQALQLEQVIFAGFTHEPAVRLAERLLPLLPGQMERVFYSDNGSTSTEVALKMAIQYWWNLQNADDNLPKRNKILAFKDAYHGDTFGAMSVSDRSVFTLAFHDLLFEVIFIDRPSAETLPHTLHLIQKQASSIAAFIYEPLVQGAGGMKMYAAEWMDQLLAAVQAQHIICIADEVMTGFGRTGKLFAGEYLTYKPDIICLSKGLTGGTMALGVTACRGKIYTAFLQDNRLKTFFHGHSFTANPLACAAANASIDLLLNPECLSKIAWLSEQHQLFSHQLAAMQFGNVKNLRTLGTILAFEINIGKDEYLNNISSHITTLALANGVYVRPLGNTVYIMPPYSITTEELASVYEVILTIVREVK